MLIPKPQITIVSRIVTLPTGERVQAFFAVISNQGVIEAKFLGTKPIDIPAAEQVLLLENVRTNIFGTPKAPSLHAVASPFYTLDFLMSQLARAPSCA